MSEVNEYYSKEFIALLDEALFTLQKIYWELV